MRRCRPVQFLTVGRSAVLLFVACGCGAGTGCGRSPDSVSVIPTPEVPSAAVDPVFPPPPEASPETPYVPRPAGMLTFTADIAPVIFAKCTGCHRPGQIGPFPLLCYDDVRKRARQIVTVTQDRIMPPWAAASGYCQFDPDGSLSVEDIGIIAQWTAEGAAEGRAEDLPPSPEFATGWKFGTPDLVLPMPETFELAAEVVDTNRNFVIRVPLTTPKYVIGWDFDPGNPRIVHHAFLKIDLTGWSRYQDDLDPLPGFDGNMLEGGRNPDGFNLGWLPGAPPPAPDVHLGWRLDPGTDLVLELHLVGTGKPESVQSSVALYLSDVPPTAHPCVAALLARRIEISAGDAEYIVRDEYVLPVAARGTSISPHAHFRGKDMQAWADLPDGSQAWLLRIRDWDFNWQNRYTYAAPLAFPAGTVFRMQIRYDNSAANPRNPQVPPERVLLGRRSRDEMGEIVCNLLLENAADARTLQRDADFRQVPGRGHCPRLIMDAIASGDSERAAAAMHAHLISPPSPE